MVVCLGDVGTQMVAGIDYPFRRGRTFAIPGSVLHQDLCHGNRPADIAQEGCRCFNMPLARVRDRLRCVLSIIFTICP